MTTKLSQTLLAISAGTVLLSVPLHAEDEAPRTVRVGGLSIVPEGDLGGDSQWTINPKALLGGGFNSNIYATKDNRESDVYIRGLVGLDVGYQHSESLTFAAYGEAESRRYSDSDNRGADFDGGRLGLSAEQLTDIGDFGLNAGWRRINDPLVSTGESITRSEITAGVDYTLEGPADTISVGGRFVAENFLESSRTFNSQERDNNKYLLAAKYDQKINEDESWYLRFSGDVVDYVNADSNSRFRDNYAAGLAVGMTMLVGDRATLSADVGVKNRWYDRDSRAGADDKSVLGPMAQARLHWPWQEGSHVALTGSADLNDSSGGAAQGQYALGLEGRHRLMDRVFAFGSAAGVFTHDRSDASDEERLTGVLTIGGEYHMVKGFAGRLLSRSTVSDAEVGADYYRQEFIAEVGFVF